MHIFFFLRGARELMSSSDYILWDNLPCSFLEMIDQPLFQDTPNERGSSFYAPFPELMAVQKDRDDPEDTWDEDRVTSIVDFVFLDSQKVIEKETKKKPVYLFISSVFAVI